MPDYSKGKIYTIRCRSNQEYIYVGSTTQPLSKRWGEHKSMSKTKKTSLIYSTINNDWTDWYIELYVEYPCENKEQLDKKEGEVIREIATLNMCIAGRTYKERYLDNKDIINEKSKEYYQNNKDEIIEKKKEYYQKNKEYKRQYYQRKKLEKLENNNIAV